MATTTLQIKKQKILEVKRLFCLLGACNLILYIIPASAIVSVRLLIDEKTHNQILLYGDIHAEHDNSDDGINLVLNSMQKFGSKKTKALGKTPLTCGIELPREEPGGIWGKTFTKLAPYVYKRKLLRGFFFFAMGSKICKDKHCSMLYVSCTSRD